MIHPVLYPTDLLWADLVKVCSLWEESPDHAVVIFNCTFFPSAVAMAIVDVKSVPLPSAALAQEVILQELTAVVCCDAFELLSEVWCVPLQPVHGFPDGPCLPIGQLQDDLLPA